MAILDMEKHAPIFSLLKQTLLAGEYPLTRFIQSVARLKKWSVMLYGSALWLPMFGQWLKENYRTFISLLGRWRGSSREMRWRYGWLSLGPFGTPGTSFVLKLSSPNQVIYSVEPQPCYKTINDWISTLWDHKHLSVTPCLTGALYMFLFIYLV